MWKSAQGAVGPDAAGMAVLTIADYNADAQVAAEAARGWTADEHLRFLDGLEVYGQQQEGASSTSPPWALIASYVQTRSEAETKEHGERYLHALLTQSLLVTKASGVVWTADEDKQFENALAEWIHTPHAWTKIAMQLPGKTVYDVMDRYDALVRDLTACDKGIEPAPVTDIHEANMALIASIACANDNHVLYDVFKEAYDNPCSVEIATYVASAVVGMVASTGQTNAKRGRPKGKAATEAKKPPATKVKKSPRKKPKVPKAAGKPWDQHGDPKKQTKPKGTSHNSSSNSHPGLGHGGGFLLPPLGGKIPPGVLGPTKRKS
ncbi:Aste57867_13737 [Aphanomyces stellatus]|uniref:Aste57867_13737 protein n=1 Tax=Aphanomyces stellatus TaxID=120398 RepID=A0A485L121_9STRA|nr:hypothetical protein As57867_013687 [Aphanomyces stellatus]VFT90570.1 Aste57867_13737 [Aphanomyces stellatus]